jgi:general stress protein YciG
MAGDVELAETIMRPERMFALWAIHTGFCRTVKGFQDHLGPELTTWALGQTAAMYGLIQRDGALLRLTPLGETLASDLAGQVVPGQHDEQSDLRTKTMSTNTRVKTPDVSAFVPVKSSEAGLRGRSGPKAGTAAARRGGEAVRAKYGREYFSSIGKKGGDTVRREHGSDFYAEIGKKGGETTKARQGHEFYARIGKKGGERRIGKKGGERGRGTPKHSER